MTTTKPRRHPELSEFQYHLHDVALRDGAREIRTPNPDSPGGIALRSAITRYAVDGFGRLRRGCPHTQPGVPAMLLLDENTPKVRCIECAIADPPTLNVDLDICRLCGTGSRRFCELTWLTPDNLTITVNLCPLCERDLTGMN